MLLDAYLSLLMQPRTQMTISDTLTSWKAANSSKVWCIISSSWMSRKHAHALRRAIVVVDVDEMEDVGKGRCWWMKFEESDRGGEIFVRRR
jgi:hypothetical protein